MTNLAVNDAGDVLAFDGKAWKPASIAQNDKGERMAFDGQAWHPIDTMVGEARGHEQGENPKVFGSETLGYIDNLVRQAANGVTFGYADELSSLLDSALGRKRNYDEALAENRAQDKAFSEKNPIASGAANVAGSIGTAALAGGAGLLPSVIPKAVTSVGPSLIGNVAKGAAVGAGLGGLQGFGEGEGDFSNRLGQAATGAVLGAAGGGVAPVVGIAAQRGLESAPGRAVAQTLFSQNPAESGAVSRIAGAMERARMTPDQIAQKLDELGPSAVLADVDPQFLREARRANTLPGNTSSLSEQVLKERNAQTGNRLVGSFEGGDTPPSTFDAQRYLDANRRQVGNEAYGAMKQGGLEVSDEMKGLLEVPAIRNALDQIQQDVTSTGTQISPVEVMHRVKQKLNDTAAAAFASGKPVNKADVRDLADRFEQAFYRSNPAAQRADQLYAQASSLPEYMGTGRNFMLGGTSNAATDVSAPALADMLANASPQQRLLMQTGATNAAREKALEGTAPARALASRISGSDPITQKLVEIYGPERAQQIANQAAAEMTFANTSNELLRGSKTAEKMAEGLDTGNAGFRVSPSGITPRFFEHLKDLPALLMKPNEAVRNEIGRLTLTPDAEKNRRTLKLIEELMKRRGQGSPVPVAAGSALGSSIAGPQ